MKLSGNRKVVTYNVVHACKHCTVLDDKVKSQKHIYICTIFLLLLFISNIQIDSEFLQENKLTFMQFYPNFPNNVY